MAPNDLKWAKNDPKWPPKKRLRISAKFCHWNPKNSEIRRFCRNSAAPGGSGPKQYEWTRLCLKTVAPSNTEQKWKWPMNNELLWHFNVHTTDSLWNIAVHKLLFRTSFPAYPPRPDSLMKSLITWYISAPLSHLTNLKVRSSAVYLVSSSLTLQSPVAPY